MKVWVTAIASMCLLMTGCAQEDDSAQQILQQYETMETCAMEAVVRCEYETESREYTMQCEYEAGGKSVITILKPTALQGLSITFDGENSTVVYEDLILDAPLLGENRLSPADILPRLMDAVKNGWLLEQNVEQEDGETLWHMVFEMEENGIKQYWTVLFDEKTGVPVAAEVSEDSRLFFTIEFTNFTFNDIIKSTH